MIAKEQTKKTAFRYTEDEKIIILKEFLLN
jgi:hypothetical protein